MCDCVATMNAVLAEHNAALVVPLVGPARCMVDRYQIQTGRGTKKPPYVFANHCPFCGEKYPREGEASCG